MKIFFTIFYTIICYCSVSAQYNLTFASEFIYPDTIQMSGCWGYNSPDGKEYALVGTSYGTSIVDITNPSTPNQLFFVPGPQSTWREIKTWDNHAYVTTEGGGGLMIIDLTNLPDAIDTVSFKGTIDHPLNTAHTLYIDESGYGYIFGYNVLTGSSEGAYIVDLNADPELPEYVSEITSQYIHDGFVRNDTLWAACIYSGGVYVFDVSDKSAIELIGIQTTSASATHNCWVSDDGKYLFTTDEIWTGFISAFDVTDITDMKLVDQIKHGAKDSTIAHNTYYYDGYLVTAHYSEGATIHDAHRPENLVEVAHYDTSPFGPDGALEGAWGIFPYFNSGTIIVSDIQQGLIVLQPNYQRACYLEGNIWDDISFDNIINAKIELVGTDVIDSSNIIGAYKTGYHLPGNYDVIVSKEGCETKTINDVNLSSGEITNLNVLLDCGTINIHEQNENNTLNCFYDAANANIQTEFLSDQQQTISATLINAQGAVIINKEIQSNQTYTFDTTQLPNGIYFFEFRNMNGVYTKKIMIY